MAKFCTKCGKELKEGQVCDCSKKEEKTTTKQEVSGGVFDDFGEIMKGTFTAPLTTIKEFSTESNFVISLIFLGICAISSGIFVYSFVDEIMSTITSMLSSLGSLTSLLGGASASSMLGAANMLKVSFGDVFFTIFIYIAVYLVVLSAMLLLMIKVIFKEDTNFKKIISVVGLSSIVMSCTLILGAIAFKIKLVLGLILFILGLVFSSVILSTGIMESIEGNKNKMVYSIFTSLSVALFVLVYVLPKLFS